ncbi:MAG: hypothetical protein WAK82_31805 [Streptosporangiaceae bacterium]
MRLIFSWAASQEPPPGDEPADADDEPADADDEPADADDELADGDDVVGDDAAAGAAWLAHPVMTSPHAATVRTPKAIARGSRTT